MTPEERSKLDEKRWLALAKLARPSIARAISAAMKVTDCAISFADRSTTVQITELFVHRARGTSYKNEVPTRSDAIQIAKAELGETEGPAYILPEDYHACGVIPTDFATAFEHLDALLASQDETIRLITANGDTGLIISTQESSHANFPRFITIWKPLDPGQLTWEGKEET